MSTDTSSVAATEHARDRFRARASAPPDSVLAAWRDGEQLSVPESAPVPSADEFRYDRESEVVVCRVGPRLTTTYGLGAEHLTNIHGVAVAAAVDAQFGTSYRSTIEAENLEEAR
jgi:hypothetical protein